jgi:hypothetical protein
MGTDHAEPHRLLVYLALDLDALAVLATLDRADQLVPRDPCG